MNLLKETVADDIEHLQISQDQDARIGHKSVDSSFFSYKTHIALSEERIITAATITTGEKSDGKQLGTLIEKSQKAMIKDDFKFKFEFKVVFLVPIFFFFTEIHKIFSALAKASGFVHCLLF